MVIFLWYLDLQLLMQSVPFTTKVASSNPDHCSVYFIQYYVIKFVSDLQHFNGFLEVLWFHSPLKLVAMI